MAFQTDLQLLNLADDYQDWTYSNWGPTDNDSAATTPIYIEGGSCQWWPLSKGITDGYAYAVAPAGTLDFVGKLFVWFWNLPLADIANIPLTNMRMRACSTSWTSNYREWDAKVQVASPKNVPISGHVPLMAYSSGSYASNGNLNCNDISHQGLIGTTGNTNDGKQGGFDWCFLIGAIGYQGETRNGTFFSALYTECYEGDGTPAVPGQAQRPLGILSKAGTFYQTNVAFLIGLSTQTVNTVITESGKTIFFANVEPEHCLGYRFEQGATYKTRFDITDIVHFWNEQDGASWDGTGQLTYTTTTITRSTGNWFDDGFTKNRKIRIDGSAANDGEYLVSSLTYNVLTLSDTLPSTVAETNEATMSLDQPAKIFLNPEDAEYFKVTGCSFSSGGEVDSPPDTVNRWIRTSKFDSCKRVTISDGEFSDCIVSNGEAVIVSGDADLTGTQILTPIVAADKSGLVWNGNFDPVGNLDGMSFTKGTNAHHAIEFGTGSPLTMELKNITVSGFNAADAQNDSVLHIKRTSGTVNITLTDCTGTFSYKSAGATVNLIQGAVTVKVTATTDDGTPIQNALVHLRAANGTGPFPYQETVTITRSGTVATVAHTAHGMAVGDKVRIYGSEATEENFIGTRTIVTVPTANSYTYTVADTGPTTASGTITATFVALAGLTDVNGEISTTRVYASNQPVTGWARKMDATPYYKQGPLGGSVSSADGYNQTAVLVLDE